MAITDDDRARNYAAMINQMMKTPDDARKLGTTLGWDVVVSYSEDEINRLLHDRFQEIPNATKTVQFTGPRYRTNGKAFVKHYTINFGVSPEIKFNAASATCQLRVKVVAATYAIEEVGKPLDGKTFDVVSWVQRNPFVIVLDGFDLALVQGNRLGKSKASIGYSPDKTLDFSTNSPQTPWMTLSLPLTNGKLDVSVLPNPDLQLNPKNMSDLKSEADLLQPHIAAFFHDPRQVDAISYSLSALNNVDPAQNHMPEWTRTVAAPVSCRFATFKPTSNSTGVLSLFIHVENGKDAGEIADIQGQWTKQWTANNFKGGPVPEGYSASLIFNPDAAYSLMIEPGLKHSIPQWFKTARIAKHSDSSHKERPEGIGFDAYTHSSFPILPAIIEVGDGHVWQANPQFKFDLDDKAIYMDFKQLTPEGVPVCRMDWTLPVDSNWLEVDKNRVAMGHANFRTTATVAHDVPLRFDLMEEQSVLRFFTSLDVEQRQLYLIDWSDRPLSVGDGADNFFGGNRGGMNSDVKAQLDHWWWTNLPSLDLRGEMDIFLITNLLLPGSNVFEVDRMIDPLQIRVPLSMVLVGSVVPK